MKINVEEAVAIIAGKNVTHGIPKQLAKAKSYASSAAHILPASLLITLFMEKMKTVRIMDTAKQMGFKPLVVAITVIDRVVIKICVGKMVESIFDIQLATLMASVAG